MKNWYKAIKLDLSARGSNVFDWSYSMFCRNFISQVHKNGGKVYSEKAYGFFEPSHGKKIHNLLKDFGTEFYEHFTEEYGDLEHVKFWLVDYGVVHASFQPEDNYLAVTILSHDKQKVHSMLKDLKPWLSRRRKDNAGKAYVLANERHNLITREVGVVGVPLIYENYSAHLQEKINDIINDFKSPTPNGRLVILEGVPGTGKTFLIRSLINECPAAMFVVVPPTLVARLGDPSLIPTLLRLKEVDDEDKSTGPVVLIVEDADYCLVERDNTRDMATINSMLNLTDGILGEVLDIRIIATTNAGAENFDEAILRDGRMSVHMKISELQDEEAQKIYKRLVGNEGAVYKGPPLLTSIYAAAKKKGYKAPINEDPELSDRRRNKKRPIGFGR